MKLGQKIILYKKTENKIEFVEVKVFTVTDGGKDEEGYTRIYGEAKDNDDNVFARFGGVRGTYGNWSNNKTRGWECILNLNSVYGMGGDDLNIELGNLLTQKFNSISYCSKHNKIFYKDDSCYDCEIETEEEEKKIDIVCKPYGKEQSK